MNNLAPNLDGLHRELADLIAASRQRIAIAINVELTMLYWSLGQRLHQELLGGERATYGARVIDQIGSRLAHEFGRGFEAKNLRRMVTFVQVFPDPQIVASLMRQLSWTHFLVLLPLKDPNQRLSSRSHAPRGNAVLAAPAVRDATRRWSVGTCSHVGAWARGETEV